MVVWAGRSGAELDGLFDQNDAEREFFDQQ